ncbi:hypothetical protein Hanom_Chr06g00527871 [Helianthus anomalus]
MVNDFRVESVVCIEGVVQNNLLVVLSVIAANFYLLSLSITFRSLLWSSTVFSQSFDEFQADDIQNVANELLRIRDYLFKELAQKTGQPMEQDEDFVADKEDEALPTDDLGRDDSDDSLSEGDKEVSSWGSFTSYYNFLFSLSKLPFWSLWFGHFCHFSLKLKLFAYGSLWFQFYCHFGPKINQVIFVL